MKRLFRQVAPFAFSQILIGVLAAQEPTWKPALDAGTPAIRYQNDIAFYELAYLPHNNEASIRFRIILGYANGHETSGQMYITPTRVAFMADSGHNRNFDESKSGMKASIRDDGQVFLLNDQVISPWPSQDPSQTFPSSDVDHGKAQARVVAWMQLAFTNFDEAREQFEEMTSSVFAFALEPDQEKALDLQMNQAASLEQQGKPGDALAVYVATLQNLPADAPPNIRDSVRDHLVKLSAGLNPPPTPEEAKRHLAYALAAMADWKSSGDASKLGNAVDELNQVARLAPWRPEVYYNLGIVLEGQNQYAAAARNLKLYLLGAPNAPDADAVQQKIYQLEYKAGAR